MPISLKLLKTSTFRLAAAYLLVFAISAGAILGYVYWSTTGLLEQQTEETIAAEIRAFAEQYRQRGIPGVLGAVNRRSGTDSGSVYLLTNAFGRRLAGNLASLPAAAIKEPGWIEFLYAVETPGGVQRHTARAFTTHLPDGLKLVVGRDVEERLAFAGIIRNTLVSALVLTLVLGLGGGLLTSRNFLRRIDSINDSSRAIMAGDLSERMAVSGSGDELDRLADGLNSMLEQIERLMNGMREVSGHVAHDLRTPLTRLRAQAENALRSNSKAEYRAALERTIAEADHLLKTFNALLSIASAEAGQNRQGFKRFDAADLVRDLVELYAPSVEEAGGKLLAECAGILVIRADRQLLAQALTNLIDNAIKYGVGSTGNAPDISAGVARNGQNVEITVADRGPGIDACDRERVKDRFVRLDESRNLPGSGLGLSLVAGVMKLHGGEFRLEDNNPGLIARLVLPSG